MNPNIIFNIVNIDHCILVSVNLNEFMSRDGIWLLRDGGHSAGTTRWRIWWHKNHSVIAMNLKLAFWVRLLFHDLSHRHPTTKTLPWNTSQLKQPHENFPISFKTKNHEQDLVILEFVIQNDFQLSIFTRKRFSAKKKVRSADFVRRSTPIHGTVFF